jgi:hypothetical protein
MLPLTKEAGMSGDLRFDPEAFLSEAGRGTTKSTYAEDQVIFSQGKPQIQFSTSKRVK